MKAFVVRPQFDQATRVTCEWGAKVLPWLRSAALCVVDLPRDKANRRRVERELQNDFNRKGLFLFYDHGMEDRLLQKPGRHVSEQVIKSVINTENVYLLANKIVLAVCCFAGNTLREACIDHGALAFLGYREQFSFYGCVSDHFSGCANTGVLALLNGHDIYQVEHIMRDKFLECEQYFYTGPGKIQYYPLSYDIAETFRHDKENLVVLSRDRASVRL